MRKVTREEFDKWFIKHYGKIPTEEELQKACDETRELKIKYEAALQTEEFLHLREAEYKNLLNGLLYFEAFGPQ